MPRKTGCGWIFTIDEQKIVNKLSPGPRPRDEFFPKEGEINYQESFKLSAVMDLLIAKDIIRKAWGTDDVVYYLASQERNLVKDGVLSKKERATPSLFEFLDPKMQDRFLQRSTRERCS